MKIRSYTHFSEVGVWDDLDAWKATLGSKGMLVLSKRMDIG